MVRVCVCLQTQRYTNNTAEWITVVSLLCLSRYSHQKVQYGLYDSRLHDSAISNVYIQGTIFKRMLYCCYFQILEHSATFATYIYCETLFYAEICMPSNCYLGSFSLVSIVLYQTISNIQMHSFTYTLQLDRGTSPLTKAKIYP